MIENLQNNEPVISASTGWQQMHGLLNEYMPVQNAGSAKKRRMLYIIAFLLPGIFLCSTLRLDTDAILSKHLSTGPGKENSITPVIEVHSQNGLKRIQKFKPAAIYAILQDNNDENLQFNNRSVSSGQNNVFLDDSIDKLVAGMPHIMHANYPIETVRAFKNTTPIEHSEKDLVVGKRKKLTWNFFGGIGTNINAVGSQNLQPYPVAEARLNIGGRYYVAAGIAAPSPVAGSFKGIGKTVYVNDAASNINLYNEKSDYYNFRYADIPVLAGINFGRHWSVETGLQLSLLLKKQTNKTTDFYDYQLNRIPLPGSSQLVTTAAASQKEFVLETRNTDMRLLGGVRFSFNKMSVSMNYQHGLQSIGKGNVTANSINKILAIRVLYQLK